MPSNRIQKGPFFCKRHVLTSNHISCESVSVSKNDPFYLFLWSCMFATLVFGCPHPTVHPSKDCLTIYFSMPSPSWLANFTRAVGKKYTSGPRYWNVPVLVNTGTFLVYQYCLKMWYLCSLEHAGVIQKLTILECENGLVLSNRGFSRRSTHPVGGPARAPCWIFLEQQNML